MILNTMTPGLFVVSSNHAEPVDQFTKMTQQQHNQQHGQSSNQTKWFCPNVLRYYVLLHDVNDGDMAKYVQIMLIGFNYISSLDIIMLWW